MPFPSTSSTRSTYYNTIAADEYKMCGGIGVIAKLLNAIRNDYIEIFDVVNDPFDESKTHISIDTDCILECKWMIQIYDLEGTLN